MRLASLLISISTSMASLNTNFFVRNKDKKGFWNIAWIMGSTPDQPLPQTREQAIYHFLETGSLEYLPNSSHTVLNVLTDGHGDFEDMAVRIPDKCEYYSIIFTIFFFSSDIILMKG